MRRIYLVLAVGAVGTLCYVAALPAVDAGAVGAASLLIVAKPNPAVIPPYNPESGGGDIDVALILRGTANQPDILDLYVEDGTAACAPTTNAELSEVDSERGRVFANPINGFSVASGPFTTTTDNDFDKPGSYRICGYVTPDNSPTSTDTGTPDVTATTIIRVTKRSTSPSSSKPKHPKPKSTKPQHHKPAPGSTKLSLSPTRDLDVDQSMTVTGAGDAGPSGAFLATVYEQGNARCGTADPNNSSLTFPVTNPNFVAQDGAGSDNGVFEGPGSFSAKSDPFQAGPYPGIHRVCGYLLQAVPQAASSDNPLALPAPGSVILRVSITVCVANFPGNPLTAPYGDSTGKAPKCAAKKHKSKKPKHHKTSTGASISIVGIARTEQWGSGGPTGTVTGVGDQPENDVWIFWEGESGRVPPCAPTSYAEAHGGAAGRFSINFGNLPPGPFSKFFAGVFAALHPGPHRLCAYLEDDMTPVTAPGTAIGGAPRAVQPEATFSMKITVSDAT